VQNAKFFAFMDKDLMDLMDRKGQWIDEGREGACLHEVFGCEKGVFLLYLFA